MTAFVLTKPTPAAVTGLALQSGLKATTLVWNKMDGMTYEVWSGATNNVNSATKVASPTANSFALVGLNDSMYFWVRAVNAFGTAGAYTGPVQYSPSLITSNDVQGSASVSSANVPMSQSNTNVPINNYGQWYTFNTTTFTPSDDTLVSISMGVFTSISSITTPGISSASIYTRIRLRDLTTGQDVPSTTKQALVFYSIGSLQFGTLSSISNFHENYIAGFRGVLIPGHNYAFYGEVMKERSDASATVTIGTSGAQVLTSSAAAL